MKKLTIIALAAVLLLTSGCVRSYRHLAAPVTVVEEKVGSADFVDGAENTVGASASEARTGYCVRQGDGVYFIRFRDSGKKQLCRYDVNTHAIYQIKDDFSAYFINVMGDYVFYAGTDLSLNVLRVSTGETERLQTSPEMIQFIVSGGEVYYGWKVPDPNAEIDSKNKNSAENADKYFGYIARQPLGGQPQRVVDGLAFDERFFIDGDRLYYIEKFDKSIASIELDGKNEFSTGIIPRFTSAWFPQDGYIYCVVDDGGIKLARISADGSGARQLLTDTIENLKYFGVENDALYYVSGKEAMLTIRRVDLETMEETTLLTNHELDKEYMYFNMVGGALFMYPSFYASSALLDLETLNITIFK